MVAIVVDLLTSSRIRGEVALDDVVLVHNLAELPVKIHTTGNLARSCTKTTSSRATSPLILLDVRRSTAMATISLATRWSQTPGVYETTLINLDDYGLGRRSGIWMNPVFEADYIDRMFAKCHEDFAKDPLNTSYLIVVPDLRDAPSSHLQHQQAGTCSRRWHRWTSICGRDALASYRLVSQFIHHADGRQRAARTHLRFGHAHSIRIDALTANGVPTGLKLEPRELTVHCNPSCSCATCKATKMPRHGPYRAGDPHRHEHLDAFAYSFAATHMHISMFQ
eukprot:1187670-Prorocentrum_minimum.AAC.4